MTSEAGLAVVDFSGTLSLDAARFAAPGRLTDELAHSGLADLGIATPDVFWQALVSPTWERGSTTTAGYVTVLTDAAVAHLARDGVAVDDDAVRTAVGRFADRYLAASGIAPAWWPWLRRLAARPAVTVVVATDHYAEATDRVLGQLSAAGLRAAALPGAHAEADALVANSADIGHHKQDRAFWRPVTDVVGDVDRVAVIDDFGANEPGADAYGDHEEVERRRRATTHVLAEVFSAAVSAHPFVVAADAELDALVDRVGRAAAAALTPPR